MNSKVGTFIHNVCKSCETEIEEPNLQFRCLTCPDESESHGATKCDAVFCNFCIVPHTRKNHQVTDSKGNSVIICDKHKLPVENFCLDCSRTVCYKCTKEHLSQKHEIASLEEKALEIKQSVHAELEKLDECYKPVALASDKVKQQCSKFDEFRVSFEPDALSLSLQKGISEIVNNCVVSSENQSGSLENLLKVLVESSVTLNSQMKRLESEQTELRSLLGESDAALVEKILAQKSTDLIGKVREHREDAMPMIYSDLNQLQKELECEEILLKDKIKGDLDEYLSNLERLTQRNLDKYSPMVYRRINNARVIMAKSRNFFCVAHFPKKGYAAYLDMCDINSEEMSQVRIPAVEKYFLILSGFGEMFIRSGKGTVTAVASPNHLRYLAAESVVFKEKVLTFAMQPDNWVCYTQSWLCRVLKNFLSPSSYMEKPFVNATISKSKLFFCLIEKQNSIICGHVTLESQEVRSSVLLPFQLAKIDFAAIEKTSGGLVAIVCCFASCSFEWVKLDDDMNATGPTKQKQFDIKAKVNQVMFFNSDCYMKVSTGTILKYSSFFGEK